jgi:hypothetical protein
MIQVLHEPKAALARLLFYPLPPSSADGPLVAMIQAQAVQATATSQANT